MKEFFYGTKFYLLGIFLLLVLGIARLLAVDSLSLSTTNIDDTVTSGTTVANILSTNASGSVVYSFTCATPGVDDSKFSIGGAGFDELIIGEDPDFFTQSSYSICIRAHDDEGDFDQNFTLNVLDKTLPELSSILVTSNNSSSGFFAKAGDEITFSLNLLNLDSWGVGNNLLFDLGTSSGEVINFIQDSSGALFQNQLYTVSNGQSGTIDITGLTFVDDSGNSLSGFTLPYSLIPNIIVDTLSPIVNFSDDVSAVKNLTDDINIVATDDYLDISSLVYGFSSDSICDGSDTYDQAYVSGNTFTISDTLNNGKYICVKASDYAGNITYLSSANPLNIATTAVELTGTGIDENLSVGTTVGDLSTVFSTGSTFTYAFVSGSGSADNGSFSISGTTLSAEFSGDYETKNTYNIRISSTDENSNIVETEFVITVNDVNEQATDLSLSPVSIDENSSVGTSIGDFTTIDQDTADTYIYTFISGTGSDDNASFSISGSTLISGFIPNYETKTTYSVLVRSTDSGGLTYDKAFTIYVNNLAEAPTDITLSGSNIDENSSIGTLIGDFSSTDEDLGDMHNYSLVSGTGGDDNALFSISGSSLHVNGLLDFETKSTYSILVRSTDLGSMYLEKQFNITINNLNDLPTDITLTGSTIDENVGTGVTVGTLTTTDEDLGDTHTYAFVTGTGDDDNVIFSLSGTEIIANFNPDYEVKNSYTIRLQTTDTASGTFEKAILITINDINEQATDVNLSSSTLDENVSSGTGVGDFTTIDQDTNDAYTYSLIAGTGSDDNASFSISGSTLVADFSADYETKNSYSVLVRSTDSGGLTIDKQFTISINDVNAAPSDLTLSGSTIDENLSIGTIIGDFTGTDDGEDTGTLTYSFTCSTGGLNDASFTLSGNTLLSNGMFNYETKNSYDICVRVSDGVLSLDKGFTITINDVNEQATDITLSGSTIDENLSSGIVVGDFTTVDEDTADTYTYSLVSGTGGDDNIMFSLSGASLLIGFSADYETKNSYSILVRSTDSGGLTIDKQFAITINDVNLAPSNLVLSGSTINENSSVGTIIGDLLGTDDGENGGILTYSLSCTTPGTDDSAFALTGSTLISNTGFNYETKNSYDICARVSDGTLSYDKNFTISIVDVNEAPTDITLSGSTLDENMSTGSLIGDFSTIDQDTTDSHTYSLVAGTGSDDNASFSISGSTLVAEFSADYEIKNTYSILVRTTDSGGLTYDKQFTISINDINLAPTDLTLSGSTVFENTFIGTVIGAFSGTDDGEDSGTLTYTFTCNTGGLDDSKFSIVGNELRTSTTINFESGSTLGICVKVSDGVLSLDKNFVIDVSNVNESPYNFILTQNLFSENVGTGFIVGDLSSMDEDLLDSHTYSFGTGVGSTDNSSFSLSGSQLLANFTPNYELKNLYQVKLIATDNGGLITDLQTTVTVGNVNEIPTDITLTNNAIDENVGTGAFVGSFDTTDEDTGDSHTYSLVAGSGSDDNASFSIVSNALITNFVGDYETKNTYSILVRTTDGGGLTFDKQFTININNVDETGVVVTLSGSTLSENMSTGTLVGDFNTTSSNTGAISFTYSLVSGTGSDDNALFSISGSTLVADFSADYETKNTYSILVRSTDNLSNITDKQFTINILNQNELPLDISLSASSIDENTIGIYIVGNFSTTDTDSSDSHTYNLVGGVGSNDNADFGIVGNSLVSAFTPDYETKNTYYIRIRSTDAGGLTTEKQFIITINDLPENPTDITFSGSLNFDENMGTGLTLGDFDTVGTNSGVTYTYTLTGGVLDNDSFSISGSTISAEFSADYETKNSYSVLVRSTDSLGYFTEKTFTFNVNNVNEQATDINLSSSTLTENLVSGTSVGDFTTVDQDTTDTYNYSLIAGTGSDDNASFSISGSTLVADFSADYEVKNSYSVLVRSTDSGGLTIDKQFTITISNLNTAPSDLTLSGSMIDENLSIGTTIGDFTGTDDGENNGTLTYSLNCNVAGVDDSSFTLSGTTLLSNTIFNFEAKSSYDICVRVSDGSLNLDKNFTITINDLVENPTDITFTGSLAIDENTASGFIMGDFDSVGINTGVTYNYTLVAGTGSDDNSSFTISGTTLSTNFVPDYETKNTYSILVRTTDNLGASFEKQFTITINDLNNAPTDVTLSGSIIDENLPSSSLVGTLSGTDDGENNGALIYALSCITTGVDDSNFVISGTNLLSNGTFDYETKNTYNICIRISDGMLSLDKNFVISINDLPDTPNDITFSGSLIVNENTSSGLSMGDFDTASTSTGLTYTYSLVAGTGSSDNGNFTISGSTLITNFVGDYETKSTYSILVRSTDNLSGIVEKQFSVIINNVNETPTNISINNNAINENLPTGTTVGSFTTSDIDAGGTFVYTLVSGTGSDDNSIFSISGNNLVANFSADYETKTSYTVRVRTTDNGGLFIEKQFTVNINNIINEGGGSSGGSSGGGGGGSNISLVKDNCPDGDYSRSNYDRTCGTKPSSSTGTTVSSTGTITTSSGSLSIDKLLDKTFKSIVYTSKDGKKFTLLKTITGKYILKQEDGTYVIRTFSTPMQAKLYVVNLGGDEEKEVVTPSVTTTEFTIDTSFTPIRYVNSKGEHFIAQKTTAGKYVLYNEDDGMKLNGYFSKLFEVIQYLKNMK